MSTNLCVNGMNLTTKAGAQAAVDNVDKGVSVAGTGQMGKIGAAQSRLSFASANLANTIENLSASESTIRDADMAYEMVEFTRNQIMLQAGTSMLAQANMAPQSVLSLLGLGRGIIQARGRDPCPGLLPHKRSQPYAAFGPFPKAA